MAKKSAAAAAAAAADSESATTQVNIADFQRTRDSVSYLLFSASRYCPSTTPPSAFLRVLSSNYATPQQHGLDNLDTAFTLMVRHLDLVVRLRPSFRLRLLGSKLHCILRSTFPGHRTSAAGDGWWLSISCFHAGFHDNQSTRSHC